VEAIASYAEGVDRDDVIALVDNTVFGNSKDGILLTSTTLFANDGVEDKKQISLADISSISMIKKKIVVNDEFFCGFHIPSKKAMALFVEMLAKATGNYDESASQEDVAIPSEKKSKKPKTHSWTTFYFFMSVALFASLSAFTVYDQETRTEAVEVCIVVGALLLISTIPFFIILFGNKTPRNWKRLLGWIIVESIYNPLFGIPIWIAWARKNNKARYGDEAAFKQEALEAQDRREVARERNRKLATKMVAANAALAAYEKLPPKQRENAVKAGLHLWALAALNPDKAKQVKNAINNLANNGSISGSTAMQRIQELKLLYENNLISKQEFKSKKSEILSQI
jgi:hypothetical protein